jgi:hypothetical protein
LRFPLWPASSINGRSKNSRIAVCAANKICSL